MHIYGFAKVGRRWTVTRMERINNRMTPVSEVATFATMAEARDDCAARNLAIVTAKAGI